MTEVVEVAAASALTITEGDGDSEVDRRQMWQWAAALTVNAAIDCGEFIGYRQRWRTAMATETECDGDK